MSAAPSLLTPARRVPLKKGQEGTGGGEWERRGDVRKGDREDNRENKEEEANSEEEGKGIKREEQL